jgi:hypothetical protein
MLEKLEPTLDELLAEPIIRQVMASDGVKSDDIRKVMYEAQMEPFAVHAIAAASAYRPTTHAIARSRAPAPGVRLFLG